MLVFNYCVNYLLYKTYPATVLQYKNLWRNALMYVITTNVIFPHTSKTGDTTHEATFHATVSVTLLIHAVLKADR
jgi:hypothetical protein